MLLASKVINQNNIEEKEKEKEETKTQNSMSGPQPQSPNITPANIILEEFMSHFDELLSQIKYNLQSFNKKCDSMDRCFGNVLLLKSNKPFDEEENHEDEIQKQIDELYSEYNPNNINKKQNKKKNNKDNLKITSKELNNIEKMFEDMNENKKNPRKKNEMNINDKKRKQGRAPYKYMYEIDKILKGGKIKDEEKYEKKNKRYKNKNEKTIKLDENDDDDEQFIDHIILDKKIEKYTQFKEMLKKFEESKKDDAISDYENIDDDLDLDFDD